jgi:hypothetical protein
LVIGFLYKKITNLQNVLISVVRGDFHLIFELNGI